MDMADQENQPDTTGATVSAPGGEPVMQAAPEAQPDVVQMVDGLQGESIRGSGAPVGPDVVQLVEGMEGRREFASEDPGDGR
jgi:hypothetical protein